jgi:hypothetical protein
VWDHSPCELSWSPLSALLIAGNCSSSVLPSRAAKSSALMAALGVSQSATGARQT